MTDEAKVDAYIAAAKPFARPILTHLRAVVHAAQPGLAEAIKWSMPMFTWHGKIVANMAAFKEHASFGTWLRDGGGLGAPRGDGMGQLGRLTSLADLPADDVIADMVRGAVALVDAGGSMRDKPRKPPPVTPDDLAAALAALPAAAGHFAAFAPSCRREYIEWVDEAKTAPTRAKRIATTVEWAAAGRRRNWQYEKC